MYSNIYGLPLFIYRVVASGVIEAVEPRDGLWWCVYSNLL